jgi:hypothetical protein
MDRLDEAGEEFRASLTERKGRIILYTGALETEPVAALKLVERELAAKEYAEPSVTVTIFEGEDHGSVLPIALLHGLETLFDD